MLLQVVVVLLLPLATAVQAAVAGASLARGSWKWVGGNKHLANCTAALPGGRCCAHTWVDTKVDVGATDVTGANNSETLWLFGGSGYTSAGTEDYLADLWS